MLYQKLKTISLKLDDKIKDELSRDKYESVSFSRVNFDENKKVIGKSSFLGIMLSEIRLTKIRIFYFSFLSFVADFIIIAIKQILIIFGDPAKSFDLLYRQRGLSVCPIPYSQFKQKQRHAKVFSLAGITTIILITAMSSLLVNLMVGPIERTFAASYNWTQTSWGGGTSGTALVHDGTDNSDWSYYASKDAGVVAGTDLVLQSSSGDAGDSTTFDTFDDANTDDETSLTVASNSVTLLKPDGAACGSDSECENNICCCGVCESSCPTLTFAGSHKECECDPGISGTVVSVSGGTICKITGSNLSVPGGWSQASNWQRYSSATLGGDANGHHMSTRPNVFSDEGCIVQEPTGDLISFCFPDTGSYESCVNPYYYNASRWIDQNCSASCGTNKSTLWYYNNHTSYSSCTSVSRIELGVY